LAELVIRNPNIADAELLTELGARTFSETFAADNTVANMTAYLASAFNPIQQANELSDPDSCFKIAEIDGLAVGYALLHAGTAPSTITGHRPIELVRLYVSISSIGSGVGSALMQECLNEAASQGYTTLWLGVWENNHRAQAFYRKWKFVEVGTHIFELGDDAQTDLLMQRPLSN
jgi:ribosomal protein S18 acetylase RimI-like enzyme